MTTARTAERSDRGHLDRGAVREHTQVSVTDGECYSPIANGVNGGSPPGDQYRLSSLHHVLDVLEFLSTAGPEVALGDVARNVGLGKPGVHKILKNLESRGYVRRAVDSHTYSLGVRLWELGVCGGELQFFRDIVRPYLAELTARTGETSHLVVYDRGEVLYVERAETEHAIKAYGAVGDRAPAYCVATGKVLLAGQPAEEVARVVEGGLQAFTEATITDPDRLVAELDTVRRHGYGLNRQEWRSEVVGVAVTAGLVGARMSTAIGLSGPAYRFGPRTAAEAVPALRATAAQLRREGIVASPERRAGQGEGPVRPGRSVGGRGTGGA